MGRKRKYELPRQAVLDAAERAFTPFESRNARKIAAVLGVRHGLVYKRIKADKALFQKLHLSGTKPRYELAFAFLEEKGLVLTCERVVRLMRGLWRKPTQSGLDLVCRFLIANPDVSAKYKVLGKVETRIPRMIVRNDWQLLLQPDTSRSVGATAKRHGITREALSHMLSVDPGLVVQLRIARHSKRRKARR